MMMEAVSTSETSVNIYQTTRSTIQSTAIFILAVRTWNLACNKRQLVKLVTATCSCTVWEIPRTCSYHYAVGAVTPYFDRLSIDSPDLRYCRKSDWHYCTFPKIVFCSRTRLGHIPRCWHKYRCLTQLWSPRRSWAPITCEGHLLCSL
jgi:hypothetical protein